MWTASRALALKPAAADFPTQAFHLTIGSENGHGAAYSGDVSLLHSIAVP